MGESSGLGGIGAGGTQGTAIARGQNASGPAERDYVAEARSRQQGRNGAVDFAAMTHVFGAQQLQEPLPPDGFEWLGPERGGQRPFMWTFNTGRGGLEMQRDYGRVAYSRLSDSSLVTHAGDRASLPFEISTQELSIINYLGGGTINLLHADLDGRAVIAVRYSSSLYAETSITDPTIIQLDTFGSYIYSLANVIIDGKQNLVVLTGTGAYFLTALDPITFAATNKTFPIEDRDGGGSFVARTMVQSLLPGLPLIVDGQNDHIYLVGVEPTADVGDRYNQKANLMLHNAGIQGTNLAVGFGTVGNLAPAAYWLQSNGSGVGGAGFTARLVSVNAFGTLLQDHQISIRGATGAAFCRQRGLIALHDNERVITWSGREEDTFIFANEPNNPGYRTVIRGIWERDGQLFASVDELPFDGTIYATGRCRNQIRRFDFDLRKWSAVGPWYVFAELGAVGWYAGGPQAGNLAGNHGYVTAVGGPDLPSGPATRAMHSLASSIFNASGPSPAVKWYHKYEATPGTDPYSLNGSSYGRSPSGTTRWAARIFDPGYEYCDKYVDYIEWGGEDSGDTDSQVIIRVGENGQLDELTPPPLTAVFSNPVSHQDRRIAFSSETSLLFPQVEVEIVRGSDHTKTAQALPFTIYGHVDMPNAYPTPKRRPPGRSDG